MSETANASEGLKALLKALETKSANAAGESQMLETSTAADDMQAMEQNVTPAAGAKPSFYLPEVYNAERDIGLRTETGSQKLKKLKPKHKHIIALHLAGWPNQQIAAYLNMNVTYICIVLRDPLSQEVINSMDELHESEFQRLRIFANDALRDALQPHKPDRTRLQAASVFFKREAVKGAEKGETAEDVMQKILAKIEAQNVQINIYGKS